MSGRLEQGHLEQALTIQVLSQNTIEYTFSELPVMDANEPVAVPPQDVEMESVDGQEDPPSLAQLSVSPPPQNDPEGDGQNVEGDNDDVTDDDVRDDDAGHEGDEDDDHEGSQGSDDQDDQPEANDPTSHFISVERMDAVEETDTCPACGEVVALQEIVYLVCGHPWCSDCLNNNIRASLSSRRNWPPRCCRYMRDGIDLSTIQNHLEDDVLLRLIEVGEEYTSKNPTFCFDPKCGAFIPEIKSDEPSQWAKLRTSTRPPTSTWRSWARRTWTSARRRAGSSAPTPLAAG